MHSDPDRHRRRTTDRTTERRHDGARDPRRQNRREFCRTVATAVAGLGVVGTAAASGENTSDPATAAGLVSTRGHFDEDGDEVTLTGDHTETDFDIVGAVPGYTTDETPSDLVVGVHGVIDPSKAKSAFDDVAANLDRAGYDGPLVGFTYDSASNLFEALGSAWSESDTKRIVARRNRYKLAAFLRAYARHSPETSIHLVGHSGGGFVALETVKTLYDAGWDRPLESAIVLAAAVDDETAAMDGRYGPAIENQVVAADSFYDPDDWVMTVGWNVTQFDQSLGANPVQGTPPDNLRQHEVDVDGHGAYFDLRADGGVAEDVVAAF